MLTMWSPSPTAAASALPSSRVMSPRRTSTPFCRLATRSRSSMSPAQSFLKRSRLPPTACPSAASRRLPASTSPSPRLSLMMPMLRPILLPPTMVPRASTAWSSTASTARSSRRTIPMRSLPITLLPAAATPTMPSLLLPHSSIPVSLWTRL